MCTAITFNAKYHYFGRNLDLEHRYNESVTIMPRKYEIKYSSGLIDVNHYAMIGMATVVDGYPLYYDATNEHGLSMAGLNFVGNAYFACRDNNDNEVAVYELIPYLLSKFSTVDDCEAALKKIDVVDTPFNDQYRTAQLHWLISDKKRSIVLECTREGKRIYKNPVGVLANNPPFPYHMLNLCNYLNLTSEEPSNRFSSKVELKAYSRGMGTIGLPGDLSSASRFVRVCFAKLNSVIPDNELHSVGQMFHLLGSVEQQEGCVKLGDKYERTQYTSCCNMDEAIYYYKTYDNSQITAISMFNEEISGANLISYSMRNTQQIKYEN